MLQIRLLGQFEIRADGKQVAIPSRIAQSIFAFLALTSGTTHRREKLAGMFWPDLPEEAARKNLRQELWRIRKSIPIQPNLHSDYLAASDMTVAFDPGEDTWIDVIQLDRSALDSRSLMSSLTLYKGEFLPGFYDDWISLERERIQALFETRMELLIDQLITAELWGGVEEWGQRWLALCGPREPAYRALMQASGVRGDLAKVSSIYQRCVEEMREQLGLDPSNATRALFDGLLKGGRAPLRTASAHPAGTVTFLFTDIEGSTRLLDKLGAQYADSLAIHHEILRSAIGKWNGREVETQGDAFFSTFARASDAVQCAAHAQRELAAQAWPLQEPVKVRMGLHTGEPSLASTGYIGMDVHRAARIGDAGHGGQVLLSQSTRDLVMHELPPDVSLLALGEHHLKDMKYPTPLYQLILEGLPSVFPPLRTRYTGLEAPAPGEPPFKGLDYFDEADSELFFGREQLIGKLVQQIRTAQVLAVIIGASGSGKSSLVRAGVVPALRSSTQPWQVYVLTPTQHPLESLAVELTRDSESVTAAATLMDDMKSDPRSLALFLARRNGSRQALLVLDQLEELFTLCRDEFERTAYIDNLLAAISPLDPSGRGHVTLILTLRADFYAHLGQYPELRDAAAKEQEYIGPMTSEELRRAIEEPARRGHWEFEPGLVDLILRDVGDEPGALPLLSHALLETWKRRAGHTLTLKGYADSGGVRGAIAHTAEGVYQGLSTEEQSLAREIFLRLTELGEGTEDTRRRASFEELESHSTEPGGVRSVLNALAAARLVTLGEGTAEVSHEALIREWPTLREWLTQDREGLRLHRRLTEAAQEWILLENDPGALYRGAHLAQVREWAALHPDTLNAGEQLFLTASLNQEEREERERLEQQRRELETAQRLAETERQRAEEQARAAVRLRLRNRVISAVGIIALLLAAAALIFATRSTQNAQLAQAAESRALGDRQVAVDARSTAVVESQIRATQQAVAEANFTHAEAQRLAGEANQLLLSEGNSELIALLSLRSMNLQYTAEGDAALMGAARLDYPRRLFQMETPRSVAISANGKYMLTGGDKVAMILDASTGKILRQLVGHEGMINDVAFSPDSRFALTASGDNTARMWDVETGRELQRFQANAGVQTAVFSPEGKFVLIGGWEKTARVFDAITGDEVHQFTPNTGEDLVQLFVVFSPDGRFILTSSTDRIARLWDAATGQMVRQFTGHTGSITSVDFSSDGQRILTASFDKTARLWDEATGRELQHFDLPSMVWNARFSMDGKFVFTASADNAVRMWNISTGEQINKIICSSVTGRMAITSDGKLILLACLEGAEIWGTDPSTEQPVFKSPGIASAVAFSPDGNQIIVAGDNPPQIWEVASGRKLLELIGHTNTINYGVAFSPDGRFILTGSWDNTIRLWDAHTGQELRNINQLTVQGVAFSPDGKFMATAATAGVRLWNSQTGQELREFKGNVDSYRVAFSPDGRFIVVASGSGDGNARIFEVQTGKLVRSFFGGSTLGMNSAAFSPDGKTIITASIDKIVRLWDVQTGRELRKFIGHTDNVWTASFSPDGRTIATASADGTVRLWDTQTGQELRRLVGHTAGVENVVFSPDGKYLLSASDDGTALLWDVDYHTTMRYLCSRMLRDFRDEERVQYGITGSTPTCP